GGGGGGVGGHGEMGGGGVGEAGGGSCEEEERVHAYGIKRPRQPREIRHHSVDPDRIGIEMKERPAAELGHRVDHAAAGAEKLSAPVGGVNCGARRVGRGLSVVAARV